MRIVYLADETTGNGIYRSFAPMLALAEHRGHETRRLPDDATRWGAELDGADVVHIHRYCEVRAQRLAEQAARRGIAVVWDNDDDLGAMPKTVASHKHFSGFRWEQRLAEIRRVLRHADLVTTPSRALAERLEAIGGPRAEVLENYVPDELLSPDRRPHAGVTIGWVAGLEHQMDVERVPIRETLQRLLDERPDVNVMTIGLRLGLRSDRYRALAPVPFGRLTQHIAEFDVGIAPLADLAFNHARSNIKLKEYAAAGVPWLASPIGPYAAMGEKQGGRLVPDNRWHDELTRLIDKPRDRRKLAKRATKWVQGETLSKNAVRWEAMLTRATELARTRVAA